MIPTSLSNTHAWLAESRGLSADQVRQVLDLLLSGTVDPVAGGALLKSWAERGETASEVAAVVELLLAKAVAVPLSKPCFDLCGTGGAEVTRFNVSTTVAFLLAAAGVPVAKHGNKGSRRPNGSFDLLDALGVPYVLPPASLAQLFDETGLCFVFARSHHPAVKAAAPLRAAAGRRTIFNLAGPLANPCRPKRQLVGVTNELTASVIAGALQQLGLERAIVVRGHPGIDELSVTGPSHLWTVSGPTAGAVGHVHHQLVDHFHHPGLDHSALPGGDAVDNAPIFERLLRGQETGPLLDMVVGNAALALDTWQGSAHAGGDVSIAQMRAVVASGAAWSTYERHRSLAIRLASASS